MFENAELGHSVDKATFKAETEALRLRLLEAQKQLAGAPFAVVVVIDGLPAAGKSETVNALLGWLDPRGIQVHAHRELTDEEKQRPPMWRYWRALPAVGRVGIFFAGWENGPLMRHVLGKSSEDEFAGALDRYTEFERMLTRENVLVVKLWLHLSEKGLCRRLKRLRRDPEQAWRVTKQDRQVLKRYDRFRAAAEQMVRKTSNAEAPWAIIEGADHRFRTLAAGKALVEAIERRLAHEKAKPVRPAPRSVKLVPPPRNVLSTLDLSISLAKKEYKRALAESQASLGRLCRKLRGSRRSLMLVFEGPDAAGKGGAIRRLTAAMDARDYSVHSVSAPTDEERAHPYLWRFWRNLPPHGRVVIHDRSWYGRVLVERIEGFADESEWGRAFAEINDFEEGLVEAGAVLLKFYLAISPEEQLRRFADREVTPYKQYKLTAEDWRNRNKWGAYEAAACDMLARTSTTHAPWVLVEADCKRHARVKVIQSVVSHLRQALRDAR